MSQELLADLWNSHGISRLCPDLRRIGFQLFQRDFNGFFQLRVPAPGCIPGPLFNFNVGFNSFVLHLPLAIHVVVTGAGRRYVPAVHQVWHTPDTHKPAPGALTHQCANTVVTEHVRQHIAT